MTPKICPPRFLWERVFDKTLVGDGCWEWQGKIMKNGYGQTYGFGRKPKYYLTHRLAYETMVGKIPAGLDIDHLCRNRRCVRPAHLEPVTRAENLRRGAGSGGVLAPDIGK